MVSLSSSSSPCSCCSSCNSVELIPVSPQVYDFPPSVSRDVAEPLPLTEETYDVPPHFRVKPVSPGQFLPNHDETPIPEDVYDVPPPTLTDKHGEDSRGVAARGAQEIYDIPASLQAGGRPSHDFYDFPRDREERGGRREHNIYDIPPQVPASLTTKAATSGSWS